MNGVPVWNVTASPLPSVAGPPTGDDHVSVVPSTAPTIRQNVDVSVATRGRYITPTYWFDCACTGGALCSPGSQYVGPARLFIQVLAAPEPIGLFRRAMPAGGPAPRA